MNSPFWRAVAIGTAVFLGVMLVFWIISFAAGVPFLPLPRAPVVSAPTPPPTLPPFLK